jgi:hypothetical protein
MNKPFQGRFSASWATVLGEARLARLHVRLAELAAMGRAEPAGEDAILAEVEALKAEGVLIERTRP